MRYLLVLAMIAACGGGSEPPPGDPDPDFDDADSRIVVGVRTYEGGGDTGLSGNLLGEPPIWPYDVEPVDGACRFSLRDEMTCIDFCENGVCVGDTCEAQPPPLSAGDLTVTAGDATRTVPFDVYGYQHFEQGLPFASGDALTVSAPGDVVGAFELTAEVPPPFTITNRDDIVLEEGTPMVIRWEPSAPGSRIRVQFGADYGHAQYRSALVECDAADEDGAIAIPQDMVNRLADRALWSCGDCFTQPVYRYTRARGTAGDLEVELVITQADYLYFLPF